MEIQELKMLQALPLDVKILKTKQRIREWYEYWGGKVYVSFSGGKDSTVLLHLARELYPDIKGVYADTGLEYPEIREFVKSFDNIDWLRPKMTFREVIKKYGWNFPSKDVAECIWYARKGSKWALNKLDGLNNDGTHSDFKERYTKWKYLLNAPFVISNRCCLVMKEKPFKEYEKNTGLKGIVGTMAEESQRRQDAYLKTGCTRHITLYK